MYKKVVAVLAMIFAMLFVSIGAFAASPAVQEVEAQITQIGTVTRENRSAVENALSAYNELDDASKAEVSNYEILVEAQQILGIKDALAKLEVEYDKVDNDYTITSPSNLKELESGSCSIMPTICIYENSEKPEMVVLYNYVGDKFVWTDAIAVRTEENRYTYEKGAFIYKKTDRATIPSGKVKCVEIVCITAAQFDFELLRDALSSKETIIRFTGHEPITGDRAEYDYVLTPQNRQSITDVLHTYDLMCSVSSDVMRKALA